MPDANTLPTTATVRVQRFNPELQEAAHSRIQSAIDVRHDDPRRAALHQAELDGQSHFGDRAAMRFAARARWNVNGRQHAGVQDATAPPRIWTRRGA